MSNSLRDQLLKAGLVSEEDVQKARSRKPASGKGKRRAKAKSRPPREKDDLAAAYAARQRQERQEKQEAERRQREAAAAKKALKGKLQALVKDNLLNDPTADIAYNFTVGEKVKRIYVTAEQQRKLMAGELAIAFLDGKRNLVPAHIGEKILQLDPERTVFRNASEDEASAEDDPYRDHPIPDDLMW